MKNKTLVSVSLFCLALYSFAFFFSQREAANFTKNNPTYQQAAFPAFLSYDGEKISKVADFPDTEEFKNPIENKFVDAGIRYKQLIVCFLPIWNYDVTWCGYIGTEGKYIDVSYEELSKIAKRVNVILPSEPNDSISFWNKYGGKMAFSLIVALYIFIKRS